MTPREHAVVSETVLLEAAGEPFQGKLGVAFVIVNRMKTRHQSAHEVCWARWQFSCWLDPLERIARKFENETAKTWGECDLAAEMALNNMTIDPTMGATHYLNKEVTIQQAGKLPGWLTSMKWLVKIGQHDFYRE
jgi:spore germination cell wall hydrolase CwlJ-like protein